MPHPAPLRPAVYSGLEALPPAYADVFRDGASVSFFLTRDWFDNYAATVVDDRRRIRLYGVEDQEGHPVAVLPTFWSPRPNRALSAARIDGLSNYYSCYFGPVVSDGRDGETVARALADGLWRDRRQWDVVSLQPLERDAAIYTGLAQALRERGLTVQTHFCFGNWYLPVDGRSYADYLKSRSSVLRKNVPYNIRRLEKSGRARIDLIVGEAGLDKALGDYETVYNASWKIPEAFPGFIRGLARVAARRGWLRLGLVYVDGEPAAAQMWIVHQDVASIYKIAYDERYAKLSIGTVLTAKLMEHVIDVDRVRVVDYLSGDDDYKTVWMSRRREFWGITAFNPRTLPGVAQIARHVGGRVGRRLLERITRPRPATPVAPAPSIDRD